MDFSYSIHRILIIINDFSAASDTSINTKKYQIFFFNTPRAIQTFITHILGFSRISLLSKYLGIPLIDNNLRNNSKEGLLFTIDKRLNCWTFCSINLADHLVLLKFVLQAISIYVFSAFAAAKFVLNTIRNI